MLSNSSFSNSSLRRLIAAVHLFALTIGFCAVVSSTNAATIFDDYTPNLHNRFDSDSFIGQPFDWSGVGKAGIKWGTLISPTHIISASHFIPRETITFWEGNSTSSPTVTRTINGGQRIGTTDLWVGTLDSAVPNTIAIYDIASPDVPSLSSGMDGYADVLIWTVGARGPNGFAVGQNRYDVTDTTPGVIGVFDGIGFVKNVSGDTNFIPTHETFLQGGDSGAPTFVDDNGVLKLAGTHSYIATNVDLAYLNEKFDFVTSSGVEPFIPPPGSNSTPTRNISIDNFVPNYRSEINAIIGVAAPIVLNELLIDSPPVTLAIDADVEIAAGAEVSVTPGYTQASATLETILAVTHTGTLTGLFANIGEHLGDGLFVDAISYNPNDITVDLLQAAPGDVNGDRLVDTIDIQLILAANSFGNPAGGPYTWLEGDNNGDGLVDASDIQAILASNLFGKPAYAALPADVTVPEPTTLTLTALALVGMLACGRRRRRRTDGRTDP